MEVPGFFKQEIIVYYEAKSPYCTNPVTSGPAGSVGPERANATLRSLCAVTKGIFTAVAVASTILGAVPVGVDGNKVIDALGLVSKNILMMGEHTQTPTSSK